MFERKKKIEPEQGSDRRQVQRGGGGRPAFSYYSSSRTPENTQTGRQIRTERPLQKEAEKGRQISRFSPQLSFWLLVGLAVICLLKVLLLSTSPKVIVVGNTAVAKTYLQPVSTYETAAHKILNGSLTNRTKLTVNLDGAAAALQKEFPELQTVSLDVPLVGSRPIVYVQVAQPTVILQNPHGNYALNSGGVVLARLSNVPGGIPVVADQSGAMPRPGKQFLPSSEVAFIHTVAYQFKAAHMGITTFVLPANTPYELDVRPDGHAYIVRFNLQEDAMTQSGAAIATLQQVAQKPASYIDVRVPDRVYYK